GSSSVATLGAGLARFSDTGLTPQTSYSYSVTATDPSGNEGPASSATASTLADTTAPAPPPNVAATGATDTTISLSWGTPTDDVGIHHYTVYRGTAFVGRVTGTSYTDTGLAPNASYSYAVTAWDAAGNESAASAVASASTARDTTPPASPASLAKVGASDTTV